MAGSKYTRQQVDQAVMLSEAGRTTSQIANELGVPYRTVYAWIVEDRLPTFDSDNYDEPVARATPIEPPPFTNDDEPQRAHDMPPQRPADGRSAPPPPPSAVDALDYGQVRQYIAGMYRLAGNVVSPHDPILPGVVDAHADAAADAWVAWIRSEPRVEAFLQKMMVGTPAGQLIYVHVSMGVGYFFARAAAADLQQRLDNDADGTAANDAASVSTA